MKCKWGKDEERKSSIQVRVEYKKQRDKACLQKYLLYGLLFRTMVIVHKIKKQVIAGCRDPSL